MKLWKTSLLPFNKNDWKSIVANTNGIEDLMPTINVCSYILTICIESQKTSKTAHYILVKFQFENNLWKIGELIGKNDDLVGGICRGLTTANFATFTNIDEPPDKSTNLSSYEIFTSKYYNIMSFAIQRQSIANILTIADMHHKLWNKVAVHKHDNNINFKIAYQVITMQTLPLVKMIKNKLNKTRKTVKKQLDYSIHTTIV